MPHDEDVQVKTNRQKTDDTLSIQSNEYDRFWMWLMSEALSGMMDDAKTLQDPQKKELTNDPNDVLDEKPAVNFDPMKLYDDVTDRVNRCKLTLYFLGALEAKFAIELGAEQISEEQALKDKEPDEKKRTAKAAFLVKKGGSGIRRMYDAYKEIRSNILFMQQGQSVVDALMKGKTGEPVNADTTMDQLADRLNMSMDDRMVFFKKYKAGKNDKAIAVFKGKMKNPKGQDNEAVMLFMAKSCNEYLVDEWYSKGFHSVKNSLTDTEAKMFEKGRTLQTDRMFENEGIQNWIADRGNELAKKKKLQNIDKSSKVLINSLTGEKTLKMRSGRGMTGVFPEELFMSAPVFLSGVIARFESTKKGTSIDRFLWHNKNSDKYEAMLRSVRSYEKAVTEKKSGEAADRREEMLKRCYEYIEGKEKKRSHDFGKERFNLAMMLIKQYDTTENFEAICRRVNAVRKENDIGAENYMDGPALTRFANTYGLDQMGRQRLYDLTGKNSTYMNADQKKRFAIMETVFTPKPQYFMKLKEGFTGEQFGKIKKIKTKFHLIGNGMIKKDAPIEFDGLSDKDFAAVAYGACLTKNAVSQVREGFPGNPEKKDIPFAFSSFYTADLMSKDPIREDRGALAPVIEYGRRQAAGALIDYGKNKKEKLARIIVNAITLINDKFRIKNEADDELVADGEMAARMCKMLLRDDELMKAALNVAKKDGINFNIGSIRTVDSINTVCKLYAKNLSAREQIEEMIKTGKDDILAEQKVLLMADVVAYLTARKYMQQKFSDPGDEYRTKALQIDKDKGDEYNKTVEPEDKINVIAKYEGKKRLLKRQYISETAMTDQMKETQAAESLQHQAQKLVQDKISQAIRPGEVLSAAGMKEILNGLELQLSRVTQVRGPEPPKRNPQAGKRF